MGLVETEAIVLRTYRLAEADKIVSCLTKDVGLVRGVARGARRLKNRFGASLEPFTHISLTYFEKEGRELVSVRSAEILRSHFELARNAETVAALEYLCELASEFAPPHEPNEKLFRMVRACLEAIAEAPDQLPSFVRYYEIWILRLSGFLPDPRFCVSCNKRLASDQGETVYISHEGALRCSACSGGAGGTTLSSETHAQMRATLRLSPSEWAQSAKQVSNDARDELAQITRRLIARALERAPRGQSSVH
ncbi:MAG TPA: DNA repair protein RecO [Pyrinomonadaceae bacterium]|jgi:DNA repair protein RecO (recombination protein O)